MMRNSLGYRERIRRLGQVRRQRHPQAYPQASFKHLKSFGKLYRLQPRSPSNDLGDNGQSFGSAPASSFKARVSLLSEALSTCWQ